MWVNLQIKGPIQTFYIEHWTIKKEKMFTEIQVQLWFPEDVRLMLLILIGIDALTPYRVDGQDKVSMASYCLA